MVEGYAGLARAKRLNVSYPAVAKGLNALSASELRRDVAKANLSFSKWTGLEWSASCSEGRLEHKPPAVYPGRQQVVL